jgi:stage III sporulation protein AG
MDKANVKMQDLLKNKKVLWLLGGLGVLLLINPLTFFQSQSPNVSPKLGESVVVNTEKSAMNQYEEMYEQRLEEILNTVKGVSDVQVMVTIDSSEEMVFAENGQEKQQSQNDVDKSGGKRDVTQIDKQGNIVMTKQNGKEEPVVIKTIKPKVRGVVVAAQGVEQVKVQALITEAVQRALDVPPHRISIVPKKAAGTK